ncbi:MAG: VWA domain-containing protein [Sulfurospirillum sp.]|nr:MAG: VWA domain-containing protein [Sulfurospirillum sp.]
MSDFGFEYPWVFLILGLFLICSKFCPPRYEAIIFPNLDLLKIVGTNSFLVGIFKWLSIILALTALASPVKEDHLQIKKADGYSIVLMLDASGSMRLGFDNVPFFQKVKKGERKFDISVDLAKDFIKRRKYDEIALIVFGNFAYIASPLTYNKDILEDLMNRLYVGVAGSTSTVINDALFQSSKLFEGSKSKSKIAILLTDGHSRGDNIPLDIAMRSLKLNGVKVYTIGIGKKGDFDKKLLQKIAKRSGGESFEAYTKEDLVEVYRQIDKLEKSKINIEKYIKKRYFYEYPLFFAFLSLLFYTFLLNKRSTI